MKRKTGKFLRCLRTTQNKTRLAQPTQQTKEVRSTSDACPLRSHGRKSAPLRRHDRPRPEPSRKRGKTKKKGPHAKPHARQTSRTIPKTTPISDDGTTKNNPRAPYIHAVVHPSALANLSLHLATTTVLHTPHPVHFAMHSR